MRGRLARRYVDFSGGVKFAGVAAGAPVTPGNATFGTALAGDLKDQLPFATNMVFDRNTNRLRRRDGHLLAQAMPNTNLYASMYGATGLKSGAPSQLMVSNFNTGAMLSYTVAGGLATALAAGASGMTASRLVEFAQAPNPGAAESWVYMQDGAKAKFWGGAAGGDWPATTGTLPLGFYLLYHGNRMFVARLSNLAIDDPGSAIGWSEVGNPHNWPAANVTMFAPNDGQPLTGIGPVGPYALVFKADKTFLVYDLDTSASRQLSDDVGCISHRTIVETPRGTFFLTRDKGLAVCDGSSIKLIADPLNVIDDLETSVTGLAYYSNAFVSGDSYFLSYLSKTTGNLIGAVEYNMATDAWWPHTVPFYRGVMWDGQGGRNEPWTIDNSGTQRIGRHGASFGSGALDYGAHIQAFATLPTADFGAAERKRLRSVTLEGCGLGTAYFLRNGSIDQVRSFDVGSASVFDDAVTLPRPSVLRPGRNFTLCLLSSGVTPTRRFEFDAVTINVDRMTR